MTTEDLEYAEYFLYMADKRLRGDLVSWGGDFISRDLEMCLEFLKK